MTDKWIDRKKRLDFVAANVGNPDVAFTVHYWGVTPRHGDNPVHRHSFFEVCYVMDGEGVYVEGEQEYPLRAGTLFYSRPGVFHQIRSSAGMYLIYVAFETNAERSQPSALLRYDALNRPARTVIPESRQHASVLLWQALLQLSADKYTPQEALASAAHALLLSFLPAFCDQEEEGNDWRFNASEQQIKQATLFIRNNLSEPLQLRGVANYLHLSSRHLSRLFANTLGLPFSDYVRVERLKFAERLLAETDMPLKEIAREAGFQSIHHFTRRFCERNGLPPGKYREAGRAERARTAFSRRGGADGTANRD